MFEFFPTITINAPYLRLFACIKQLDYDVVLTVTMPVQLKTTGELPEDLSPLADGLSFT